MSYPRSALDGIAGFAPLRAACADPAAVTRSTLRSLLGPRTAFAREHGLTGSMDRDAFRRAVPIRRYEELEPWLTRALAGEPDVGFAGPVAQIARTTGTTGEPKLLPQSRAAVAAFREIQSWWGAALVRDRPGVARGAWLSLVHPRRMDRLNGVDVGNIGAVGLGHHGALGRTVELPRHDGDWLATAVRVAAQGQWTALGAALPSLATAVVEGVSAGGEALVEQVTRADPTRGAELAAILARHGRLDPRAVWPALEVVAAWRAGPSARYLPRLAAVLGAVPVRELGYAASEGHFAVALWADQGGGLLAVTHYVVELVPVGSTEALWPEQAELGQRYRVIATTPGGLWRYDTEDVVTVVARVGGLPVVEFAYREGAVGAAGERVSEAQVVAAMNAAAAAIGRAVADFVAQPIWPVDGIPCWRVEVAEPSDALARAFDQALRAMNELYDRRRATGALGPPRLVPPSPGSAAKGHLVATLGR